MRDRITADAAGESLRALYRTGFFRPGAGATEDLYIDPGRSLACGVAAVPGTRTCVPRRGQRGCGDSELGGAVLSECGLPAGSTARSSSGNAAGRPHLCGRCAE